jgi:hypothetical protein
MGVSEHARTERGEYACTEHNEVERLERKSLWLQRTIAKKRFSVPRE